MKVKKLTKRVRKAVCMLLTAAVVFTNAGMTVLAEEGVHTEGTQQEPDEKESEEDLTEKSSAVEETAEEQISEEEKFIEESAESASEESDFKEEDTENILTENDSEQDSATVESLTEETGVEIGLSEKAMDSTETKVSENDLKLAFSDTDIAHGEYKEDGNNITWVIDADGKLTVEGTGDFADAGSASDINRTPWHLNRNDIVSAEIKVSDMTNAGYMFYMCSNLSEVDLSGFDTSSVTYMNYMFYGCSSLENLDLENFITSNVSRMSSMFCGCSSLTSMDLSSFDTSNVTVMQSMFGDCSSLESLDLSNFDTSKVTSMDFMFDGCSSLKSLDISSFDTSSVKNMYAMFRFCSSLESLDISGFDTSNVTSMQDMFRECSNLKNLDVSNLNTSNVTYMQHMFAGCSVADLDLKGFDTRKVESMENMFLDCSSLTSLDLSSFNTRNVVNSGMNGMFGGCSSLESLDISGFDTHSITNMEDIFYGCSSLTSLDLSSFDMSKVASMSNLSDCTALSYIYTPCNLTSSVLLPDDSSWYDNAGKQYNALPQNLPYSILLIKGSAPETPEGYIAVIKEKTSYQLGDTITVDDLTVVYCKNDETVVPLTSSDYSTNVQEIDTSELGIKSLIITYKDLTAEVKLKVLERMHGEYKENGNDITWTIDSDGNLIVEGTGDFAPNSNTRNRVPWYIYRTDIKSAKIIVNEITNVSYMFYGCSSLESLDLSRFDTSKVTNMNYMFCGCSSLESLDLSRFDTSKVTNMNYMFRNCSNLTNIDVSSFDTSKVTGMVEMFRNCSNLTNIDVSSFDTSNVTHIGGMFYDCSNLKSIDVSNFNTSNVVGMSSMFYDCSSLTNIDVSNFDTSNVVNMDCIFLNCSNLTNIDVSNFDTSNVSLMGGMFYGCSSLESLDLSSFNTRNVKSMNSMFYWCSSLTSLNVSGFNTVEVTNMNYMFDGCSSLESLDLSSFDTDKLTEIERMFDGCSSLSEVYTTCNLKASVSLPSGEWYDMSGTIYTELPKELSYSILLAKGEKPTAATEYIAAIKGKTSYNVGDTINTDDLTVRYYGSDGTVQMLNAADYTVSKVDALTAGVKTLTITYKNLTAEITLIVSEKEEGGDTEESSSTEESGSTEESSSAEDKDDSPYEDKDRTDLASVNTVIADIKAKVYDQNAYEPVVKVTATVGGKKTTLTEGADYRVLYQNNIDAGEGKVIVKGNGIYKGQIDKSFTISKKPVKKLKVLTGGVVGTADLSTLPVYVYDGTKLLQLNKDYTLSNYKTAKPTTAEVTVTGTGNYDGTVVAKLTVYESGTQIITPENVTLQKTVEDYTGKAVKPSITVTVNGTPLTNKDYKVQYQNNKNAGTAYVIVTGKGAYKGKAVVPFTIKAETIASPNDFTIKAIPAKTYNGKLQKPTVSVTIKKNGKDKKLSKKDYTVSYTDNFHAGEAIVTVTGKGNYAGLSAAAKFTINPQKIKKASLKGTQGNLILTYSKRTLKEGTDYEKPEYGAVNKNKVPVTIKGKGDFTGEMTKTVKTQ